MQRNRRDARSACHRHYAKMHGRCAKILKLTFESDSGARHSRSHAYADDMERWSAAITDRPESPLLRAAIREYQFALLALTQGQYRQAFMALRLYFELSLLTISLSANELNLRLWMAGSKDTSWSALVDDQQGVFSTLFISAFSRSLEVHAAQYREIAKKLYRECSELVHGNFRSKNSLPESLQYDQEAFGKFHDLARDMWLVASFALIARYSCSLSSNTLRTLETTVIEQLGHHNEVRSLLQTAAP